MKTGITEKLMGAEIEYFASGDDKSFEYVNEYYSAMREVNSILLPGSDILNSLKTLKLIMLEMSKKIRHPLGTRGWPNSYGFAYNGVHLHLSGSINQEVLTDNIFKLMYKHGFSPRTVTSWHIFNRPSEYSLKSKRKHQPVYKTPRGTLEIRALDLEYFLDDNIIKDLALAIEGGYKGESVEGDASWVNKLLNIHIDDYKKCCSFLDTNLSTLWEKLDEGIYRNKVSRYVIDFTTLSDWSRDRGEENRRRREEEESREEREEGEEDNFDLDGSSIDELVYAAGIHTSRGRSSRTSIDSSIPSDYFSATFARPAFSNPGENHE